MKRLVVKDTKKYGKGVFANAEIQNGEVIHVLSGERMDVGQLVDKVLSGKENIDDACQFGRRTFFDLDEFSRTFNHSCDPTAGIRKNSELFALRDIKTGDEVTFDYSLTIAPTEWSMKCKCGSKICRKILGDILSVPPKRLEEYKKAGALQNYMKKLLRELERGDYEMPLYEKNALDRLRIGLS